MPGSWGTGVQHRARSGAAQMKGEDTHPGVLSSISGGRILANSTHFFATPLETRKAYYLPSLLPGDAAGAN